MHEYRDHVATKLYTIANNYENNSYSISTKDFSMIKKREGNITIKALIKNSSKNDIPRKQCCNCFYSLLSFCFLETIPSFLFFLFRYTFYSEPDPVESRNKRVPFYELRYAVIRRTRFRITWKTRRVLLH